MLRYVHQSSVWTSSNTINIRKTQHQYQDIYKEQNCTNAYSSNRPIYKKRKEINKKEMWNMWKDDVKIWGGRESYRHWLSVVKPQESNVHLISTFDMFTEMTSASTILTDRQTLTYRTAPLYQWATDVWKKHHWMNVMKNRPNQISPKIMNQKLKMMLYIYIKKIKLGILHRETFMFIKIIRKILAMQSGFVFFSKYVLYDEISSRHISQDSPTDWTSMNIWHGFDKWWGLLSALMSLKR